jgi:hypothetical protein
MNEAEAIEVLKDLRNDYQKRKEAWGTEEISSYLPNCLEALSLAISIIQSQARMREALQEYVEVVGGVHEDNCPMDDTCNCRWKYLNDKVNQALSEEEK